jgi:hypothetical protein
MGDQALNETALVLAALEVAGLSVTPRHCAIMAVALELEPPTDGTPNQYVRRRGRWAKRLASVGGARRLQEQQRPPDAVGPGALIGYVKIARQMRRPAG